MHNSIVLITGASKGIGLELCRFFCTHKVHVVAISRNNDKSLFPSNCQVVNGDITDPKFSETLLEQIGSLASAHKYLIHNAGLLINKPFEDLTKQDFEHMFNVNVYAVAELTARLIPWLNQSERSHTVYIGSMAGFQGSKRYGGLSAYGASKAAGASLMESLAAEYAHSNLNFHSIALGAVKTEMLQVAFPEYAGGIDVKSAAAWLVNYILELGNSSNGSNLTFTLGDPE